MSNGDAGPEPVYLEEPVLQPDAPLEVKEGSVAGAGALPSSEATSEDRRPRLSKFLLPPTRAPSAAVGARAPRRAADVAGAAFAGARHNWIPTGPRNVGGR